MINTSEFRLYMTQVHQGCFGFCVLGLWLLHSQLSKYSIDFCGPGIQVHLYKVQKHAFLVFWG